MNTDDRIDALRYALAGWAGLKGRKSMNTYLHTAGSPLLLSWSMRLPFAIALGLLCLVSCGGGGGGSGGGVGGLGTTPPAPVEETPPPAETPPAETPEQAALRRVRAAVEETPLGPLSPEAEASLAGCHLSGFSIASCVVVQGARFLVPRIPLTSPLIEQVSLAELDAAGRAGSGRVLRDPRPGFFVVSDLSGGVRYDDYTRPITENQRRLGRMSLFADISEVPGLRPYRLRGLLGGADPVHGLPGAAHYFLARSEFVQPQGCFLDTSDGCDGRLITHFLDRAPLIGAYDEAGRRQGEAVVLGPRPVLAFGRTLLGTTVAERYALGDTGDVISDGGLRRARLRWTGRPSELGLAETQALPDGTLAPSGLYVDLEPLAYEFSSLGLWVSAPSAFLAGEASQRGLWHYGLQADRPASGQGRYEGVVAYGVYETGGSRSVIAPQDNGSLRVELAADFGTGAISGSIAGPVRLRSLPGGGLLPGGGEVSLTLHTGALTSLGVFLGDASLRGDEQDLDGMLVYDNAFDALGGARSGVGGVAGGYEGALYGPEATEAAGTLRLDSGAADLQLLFRARREAPAP